MQYLFNLEDDNSLLKYVSAKKSFNDKNYVPENLIEIKSKNLIKQKSSMKLRPEAVYNLEKM
jgi:hypothetical protein